MKTPDDLIAPSRAAKLLGVSKKTVYRWAASGKLRSYAVKQLVRLSEADVRAEIALRPAEVDAAVESRRETRARGRHTERVLREAGLM